MVVPSHLGGGKRRRYSLANAVRALVSDDKRMNFGAFEMDVSSDIQQSSGLQTGGILIPLDAPMDAIVAQTNGSMVAAKDYYGSEVLGWTLFDYLRDRSAVGRLGASLPYFEKGTYGVSIPNHAAKITNKWGAFNDTPPDPPSNATPTKVGTIAKTVVASIDVNRVQILESEAAGRIAIKRLFEALSSEIDRAACVGADDSEPIGMFVDDDVQIYEAGEDGGAIAWPNICRIEAMLDATRADTDTVGWLAGPKGREKLRQTYRGTGGTEIWSDRDTIASRRAVASASVPENLTKGEGTGLAGLVFGRWDDLVIPLYFGVVELQVNPYTRATYGQLRITATIYADEVKFDPSSFIVCKDMSVA